MELDDLKAEWQKETTTRIESGSKDVRQLQVMMHARTADLLTRVRKRYEMIISCMMISLVLFTVIHPVISDDFADQNSASGFVKGLMLYLLVLFFYWLKLVSINNFVPSPDIRERLVQLLHREKRNLRIEMTFVCLVFIGGPLVSRFVYHGKALTDLDDPGVQIAVPAGLLLLALILYFIHRYHKRNITELNTYLAEYTEDYGVKGNEEIGK